MEDDGRNDSDDWGQAADGYDAWYRRFEGAIENEVDWRLLRRHLPQDTDATVLDAAGGTGRIALPLAQLGYHVTLLDISAHMLAVAKRKLTHEGLAERVKLLKGDVRSLPLADDSFDLLLCWDGGGQALPELARVARPGGWLSVFLENAPHTVTHPSGISGRATPGDLSEMASRVLEADATRHTVDLNVLKRQFEVYGLQIDNVYAVCGWLDVLGFAEETRNARQWDADLYDRTLKLVLRLAQEPSVNGLSRHLVVYARNS
jgi:SAM-dependent methyltransferase